MKMKINRTLHVKFADLKLPAKAFLLEIALNQDGPEFSEVILSMPDLFDPELKVFEQKIRGSDSVHAVQICIKFARQIILDFEENTGSSVYWLEEGGEAI